MTQKSKVRLATTSRYTLMILLAAIFALPLLFMVISSFKPGLQILQDSSSLRAFLPVGDLSMQNYFDAFDRAPVARFIFNSILVTTVTLALGLFFCSLAAFALACLRWKGQGIVLTIIIATFIVPFETIAVPLLMIVSRLPTIGAEGFSYGWLNTYHVQIIPFIVDAFTIFLFVQFFKSLPYDLIEAARIDGASWFQIYARIIVPVSGPVFATAAILKGLVMWNQYLWPIMVVQSEQYRPVMVGLGYFFQLNTAWGEIMAYLSVITIPILVLFLSLQRVFVESIASSGIKG
ncbi:MAG: carbohydrate ABC transporter permease [Anaerolineae bacterium]|nr:carbohydrate ABC transporter permease [Anaerolineae bacterium]MCB9104624.1 carbohydrate ABC transporter permease [Anaerolineales bacterium]